MSEYLGSVGKICTQPISWVWGMIPSIPKETETVIVKEIHKMLPDNGRAFYRIAGLSGAAAVALGAYGAHAFRDNEQDPELIKIYETANRYHMTTTLALLAIPISKRPYLSGLLLSLGMLLFSGSCYYHALTGKKDLRRVTPYGGMMLIAGYFSLAL